jgi:hypothetical protein
MLMKFATFDVPDRLARAGTDAEQSTRYTRIRCPKCQWQPTKDSTWTCVPMGHPEYYVHGACGHSWNTFDTRGRCPGCRHQWKNTMCLSCGELSPHRAWYDTQGGTP